MEPNKVTPNVQVVRDDTRLLVSEFMDSIAIAKTNGDEWVETSPEIIRHYNRKGMGINPLTGKQNEFFLFDGIKVCPIGRIHAIEEEMDKQMNIRMHGEKEGIILGR